MSNLPKQLQYYIPGISLTAISLVILLIWEVNLFNFLFGISLLCVASLMCLLGYWKGQDSKGEKLPPNNEFTNASHIPNNESTHTSHRSIHMQGGNYNESIEGDCITIQGNQIYISQDLSQFAAQIQEVLSQLQNNGYSREAAEQQVKNDLRKYARSNTRVREKLLRWKVLTDSFNDESFNTNEKTERINQITSGSLLNKAHESTSVLEDRYKKLDSLLEKGAWEEADAETFQIIWDFMPKRGHRFIQADQIPPGVLRKLNHLWVKHSNGRFGFGVQQSIWKEILKGYDHTDSWVDEDAYLAFIDAVGWTRDDNRIYHVDFNYSLRAPLGHLPAILMIDIYHYYHYSHPSNYCHLDTEVFDIIMRCKYFNSPFIPSWLQQWLDME